MQEKSRNLLFREVSFFTTGGGSWNWIEILRDELSPPPTNVSKISVPPFKKEEKFIPPHHPTLPSLYSIRPCSHGIGTVLIQWRYRSVPLCGSLFTRDRISSVPVWASVHTRTRIRSVPEYFPPKQHKDNLFIYFGPRYFVITMQTSLIFADTDDFPIPNAFVTFLNLPLSAK